MHTHTHTHTHTHAHTHAHEIYHSPSEWCACACVHAHRHVHVGIAEGGDQEYVSYPDIYSISVYAPEHLYIYTFTYLHIYTSVPFNEKWPDRFDHHGPKTPASYLPFTPDILSYRQRQHCTPVRLPSTYTRPPYPGATPSFNPPHCRRSLAPAALVVVALSVCEPHFIRVPGPRSAGDLSQQPSLLSRGPMQMRWAPPRAPLGPPAPPRCPAARLPQE